MSGRPPVHDKNGKVTEKQLKRWREHFKKVLNQHS
jgi:hypothetical protein